MTFVAFTVHGEARPAGSKRAFPNKKTGKIIVTDDSGSRGKDWRRSVADAGAEAYTGELLRGPLDVTFTFYRPRPKGHYRTGRNAGEVKASAPAQPITRPDLLNLARAAEDALTGVIWHDDAQIVSEHLHKHFGEPARLVVSITTRAGTYADPEAA